MAISIETKISQLYVAMFGRAADAEGMDYWKKEVLAGKSFAQVADAMFATPHARPYYPEGMSNQEIVASFYLNVLGRTADAEGLAFWTGKLNAAGATVGSVVTEMIGYVANYSGDDVVAQYSADYFNNRVEVADYFTSKVGTVDGSTAALAGVNEKDATVTAAIATIGGVANELRLTVGADFGSDFVGTAGADEFVSKVVQNSLGQQVNTLGSGDELDGGAGIDTLNAKITSGSFVGGSKSMPIQPEIKNVEIINLQAVIADIDTSGNNDVVYVNAKDITDIDELSSVYSDASLVIQNVTTKQSNGTVGNTADITVGMKYTGNADSHWDESDLSVYFDQDYLVSGSSSSDQTWFWLEDRLGAASNPAQPLDRINVDGIKFTLDGVAKSLSISAEDMEDFLANDKTWEGFVALLNESLAAAQLTDSSLAGLTITLDYTNLRTTDNVGAILPVAAPAITLTAAEGSEVEAKGFTQYADALGNYDVFGKVLDEAPETQYEPVTINVALEKVGLAGDGGELIIGSMNKTAANEWGAVNTTTDTVSGIERFNVTVYGNDSKASSLAGMHSTNNNLRIVNVVTDATLTGVSTAVVAGKIVDGDFADLIIGNTNTDGIIVGSPDPVDDRNLGDLSVNAQALKDVQVFNASAFKGDLTLYAALTDEVVAKYLDLVDDAPDAAADDNVSFVYTGGQGFDTINLAISSSNLAVAGTTTREDMSVTVNGNAGNDTLVVSIQDSDDALADSDGGDAHWYLNSKLNANLVVSGGTGDDTISTLGSGDWIISGGDGADTVYVDNTGAKAVWVFNTADQTPSTVVAEQEIDNLLSDNNDSFAGLYKGQLSITLTRADGSTYTSQVVTVPSNSSYTTTDLDINQAIKLAINTDPVLSKLLVAKDGPTNTLVVTSLIDGVQVDGDLVVNLRAPTDSELSTAELAAYNAKMGTAHSLTEMVDAIGIAVSAVIAAGDYAAVLANDTTDDLAGADSTHTQDSTISGGAGDDVIVLGTGEFSNDTLKYDQVVAAGAIGNDTVVNFVAGDLATDTGRDVLDFSFYNGTAVAVAGVAVNGAIDTVTVGAVHINLVETAVAGVYRVDHVVEAGADDVTTVLGTIDFGATQTFVAENLVF